MRNYEKELRDILSKVKECQMSPDVAFEHLKSLPFSDLGFAKVDHHRELRLGLAEVVFCEGKTIKQILEITEAILERNKGNILLTRANPDVFKEIKRLDDRAHYNELGRTITIHRENIEPKGLVSIVSAGTADIPVAEEARETAYLLGSRVEAIYDVGVAGAHRLFAHKEILESSNAVVVVAGMEGALASLVGGIVPCPVIAVPTSVGYGTSFGGLAALLAMMNSCAPGVTVVNIDNGFGAGYTAGLINRLACSGEGR